MTASVPIGEPTKIRAGDTWKWRIDDLSSDYPAPTWTLKYRFRHPSNAGFEITAAADGIFHAVTVAAATTALYVPGRYTWQRWVEAAGEKFTLGSGTLEVAADYRGGSAPGTLDDRTHARKVLEAIEAVIEGRASKDQEEYAIGDRSLKRTPIAELLKLRDFYRAEVTAEETAERLAAGMGGAKRLLVRL